MPGSTKILLTMCAYNDGHPFKSIFESRVRPRFEIYAAAHGFQLVILDDYPLSRARELSPTWERILWTNERLQTMNDGDVITMVDADSCIVDGRFPPEFPGSFSVAQESTGLLCMGFYSVKASEWGKHFTRCMCSFEFHAKHKDENSWITFGENGAIYSMLGLKFGDPVEELGSNGNYGNFSRYDFHTNFAVLPVRWNVTVDPDDYIPEPDDTDIVLSHMFRPELLVTIDKARIRHFGGGRIFKPLADRYFQMGMKI